MRSIGLSARSTRITSLALLQPRLDDKCRHIPYGGARRGAGRAPFRGIPLGPARYRRARALALASKTIVDKQTRRVCVDKESSRGFSAICVASPPPPATVHRERRRRRRRRRFPLPGEDAPAAWRDSQAPAWPGDVIGEPGSSSSTRHSVSPRHSRRLYARMLPTLPRAQQRDRRRYISSHRGSRRGR